jgi:CheY-like chemotaxis protein
MSTHGTILLADDEPLSREFLQEALQSFGYHVLAVDSGTAAMQQLADASFDCVVTDLRMPGADGLAVLAKPASRPIPSGRWCW